MQEDSESGVDLKFDRYVSIALRAGVILSISLVILGSSIVMIHNGIIPVQSGVLTSVDSNVNTNSGSVHLSDIAVGVMHLSGMYIIALGLWVLIFTPIAIVVIALVNFAFRGNRLYVVMSSIVLFNLFFALVLIS